MFSLPCRVIICHSPPFSHNGNINRPKKKITDNEAKTNRQTTTSLLFLFSSFLSKPERTFFTNATSRWIGASQLRATGAVSGQIVRRRDSVDVVCHRPACPRCFKNGAYTRLPGLSRCYTWRGTELHCRDQCVQTLERDTGHSGWHRTSPDTHVLNSSEERWEKRERKDDEGKLNSLTQLQSTRFSTETNLQNFKTAS